MKSEVLAKLESAATSMVQTQVDTYLERWNSDTPRTAILTPPSVVLFRYENEDELPEDMTFSIMPHEIARAFFGSDYGKHALLKTIEAFLESPLAAAALFLSESWTAGAETKEEFERLKAVSTLRDLPDALTAIQCQLFFQGRKPSRLYVQAVKDGARFGELRSVNLDEARVLEHLG